MVSHAAVASPVGPPKAGLTVERGLAGANFGPFTRACPPLSPLGTPHPKFWAGYARARGRQLIDT